MTEKAGGCSYLRLQIAYLFTFAIWGSWNIALGSYPGVEKIGFIYAAFAFGALFAPLIGSIVDTKFAAQKVLSFLLFVSAAALVACGLLCVKVGYQSPINYKILSALLFVHGLTFMPSIPLVNTVVFKHIQDKNKSPFVFIFGTFGWILVNLFVKSTSPSFFFIGGGCALFLSLYALTLPNTPPEPVQAGEKRDVFGLRAFSMFKRWDFCIFILCVFMVSLFGSNFYFPNFGPYFEALGINKELITKYGILNQASEIIFMAALAFGVARYGLKWVLVFGMGAWALRYFLFSTCIFPLAMIAVLLHGIAYAFLYTASYMFGDKIAPPNMKASVQSLIALLILGVGQVSSGIFSENLHKRYEKADTQPSALCLFENQVYAQDEAAPAADPAPAAEPAQAADPAPAADPAQVADTAQADAALNAATDGTATIAPQEENNAPKEEKKWDKEHWKKFFLFPAEFCCIWLILFILFGKNPKSEEEVAANSKSNAA